MVHTFEGEVHARNLLGSSIVIVVITLLLLLLSKAKGWVWFIMGVVTA